MCQLRRFRFVLDRIVQLPVPSENVSWRGKKIGEIDELRELNRFFYRGVNICVCIAAVLECTL